jgi:hypothetical protein
LHRPRERFGCGCANGAGTPHTKNTSVQRREKTTGARLLEINFTWNKSNAAIHGQTAAAESSFLASVSSSNIEFCGWFSPTVIPHSTLWSGGSRHGN